MHPGKGYHFSVFRSMLDLFGTDRQPTLSPDCRFSSSSDLLLGEEIYQVKKLITSSFSHIQD